MCFLHLGAVVVVISSSVGSWLHLASGDLLILLVVVGVWCSWALVCFRWILTYIGVVSCFGVLLF